MTATPLFSAAPARPARGLPRMPALDGLRGLAVAAVVLFHAGVARLAGGFVAVDTFFVLSGFLITSLLVAEWQAGGRGRRPRFLGRRARRLLPGALPPPLSGGPGPP